MNAEINTSQADPGAPLRFYTACPSCGAKTEFQSAASVMAVCAYCQSTVHKDAAFAASVGKIGQVLEDYSAIEVGSTGSFQGVAFTVLGRLQYRYEAGLWSEWWLLFDDGRQAWLGDTSGQYMITEAIPAPYPVPDFTTLKPLSTYGDFVVTDARQADCIGGQGELPIRVGEGYQAKVVDARQGAQFLTLDYSAVEPVVYRGEAVRFTDLQWQRLRSDEAIQESAGRHRGATHVLDCPSCGSPVTYQSAVATQAHCASCGTSLDMSGDKATILTAHRTEIKPKHALPLGAIATMEGKKWTVIGLMVRRDEDGAGWVEYLLYHQTLGFQWLIESTDGWFSVSVLNELPTTQSQRIQWAGKTYQQESVYLATVLYAEGAFNWRVTIGETARVTEYTSGQQGLARKVTDTELTWSASKAVTPKQIGEWFGGQYQPTYLYQHEDLSHRLVHSPEDDDTNVTPMSARQRANSSTLMLWLMSFVIGFLMLNESLLSFLTINGLMTLLLRLPLKFMSEDDTHV